MRFVVHIKAALFLMALATPKIAMAQTNVMVLDTFIETHRISSVGSTWETITLANGYTAPVVTCTYVLTSNSNPDALTRVRNVGPSSFEVRGQRFDDSSIFSSSDVHCLVVETGAHTLSDGHKIEARTVFSDGTSGGSIGWDEAPTEDVTTSITSGFSSMVVFGQVMTFTGANASVFWTNTCGSRTTPPTPTNFCVGKHSGRSSLTRADETLGFIVTEPGTGTVNGVSYAFDLGSDTVAGTGNSPPYNYSVTGDFDTAVLQQAAEDGGDGAWAVLYGSDPLPSNSIALAVEEETAAGDTTRRHTTEEVYYGAFDTAQTALFTASKTFAMSADNATVYAIPGSDVVYTITLQNTGDGPADLDSVFLVDSLPEEVVFFTGDMDGTGPATGPVLFEAGTSRLTFTDATDLKYSDLAARPTDLTQCTYTPSGTYDANVRHICFAPKGYASPGTLYTGNTASISFRVQIP